MKRSSFWFLFLFFCFLAGLLHGVIPGGNSTIQVKNQTLNLTNQQIEILLGRIIKEYNLNIEFTQTEAIDILFSDAPIYKMSNFIQEQNNKLENKIHADFKSKNNGLSLPLFWKVHSNHLSIVYVTFNKKKNDEMISQIANYLFDWEAQLPFLKQTEYASTLISEPHEQVSENKKAKYLRQYQLSELINK